MVVVVITRLVQAEASTSGREAHKLPDKLWVDKYRPRTFLDLLSDEQINREVLRWLKSWDKLVFDYDPPQSHARGQKNGRSTSLPEHRILLISGPPGDSLLAFSGIALYAFVGRAI